MTYVSLNLYFIDTIQLVTLGLEFWKTLKSNF